MVYITTLRDHIDKLNEIRAYLCNEAPRDKSGDLIPPFDEWVHRLEAAIMRSVQFAALLQRSSHGEIIIPGKGVQS